MEFKEIDLEEIQHEHSLIPVDLQLMYQDYQEDDDDFDDNDLITTQNFKCICDRCNLEIDWYHRYYYKCSMSCNYSIHKFCVEICTTLRSPPHPNHILRLKKGPSNWCCNECFTDHQDGICYHCSTCNYKIDLRCATFVDQKTIHHPGHSHPLVSATPESILSKCFACGMKHEGDFYHCNTCLNFSINSNCLALPIKLLLKYHHSHLLTLSYSFLEEHKCRICRKELYYDYWLYKCSKCMFYVHLHCATQGRQLITPELIQACNTEGSEDCFSLPHESYESPHQNPKYMAYLYPGEIKNVNGYFKSDIHEHPLVKIHNESNNDMATTSTSVSKSVSLHNPMKRIKLLCEACVRPITTLPFYRCSEEGECPNFVLHEKCSRLRTKVEFFPFHYDQHVFNLAHFSETLFFCKICDLPCDRFGYVCSECDHYAIDVNCLLIPEKISHEAGPGHVLSIVHPDKWLNNGHTCRACRHIFNRGDIFYKCNSFDFCLDMLCGLSLPKTIRHKYDKHTLNLSYSPIENHKGQYFCEVCEEDLDPDMWFYHCSKCAQSIHCTCSPLILKSEQGVSSSKEDLVYKFLNMKFGLVFEEGRHEHPVSMLAGTNSDGDCTRCGLKLQSMIILKCFECKFRIHVSCAKSKFKVENEEYVDNLSDEEFEDSLLDKLRMIREPKIKPQPQRSITFYPKNLTRPCRNIYIDDARTPN